MLNLCTLTSLFLLSATPLPPEDGPRLQKDNIPAIVQALTLEEKATLVVGGGFKSMLSGFLGEKGVRVPGAAGTTRAIPRLGIPSIVLSDGPAGVRIEPTRKREKDKTFYATAFPTGTILACSWNQEMVEQVGRAMGNEALEYGIDVLLGPGMNLMRNPLCGRNFEYYSEDPVLSGRMAAAMIRGIQSQGVGTSAKHFALNNQETNRAGNDARVDETTARELYLKGFEIAVKEAQPWTVMSSYNKLNGEYTQSNRWLLTEVLRDEWGFEGLVMTDWTGRRNTGRQIAAGNDLMEPGLKSQIRELVSQVKKGKLAEKDLDRCVTRVLELIVKTPTFKGYAYSESPDLQAHATLAREAAADGIVLLKNEGTLPLPKTVQEVAVFGVAGYQTCIGGTGSGTVHAPYAIQIPQALQAAGIRVSASIQAIYENYLQKKARKKRKASSMLGEAIPPEFALDAQALEEERADMALFVIGRQAGEGGDRRLEDDFLLSDIERKNLEAVTTAYHRAGKKVIVVLNIGGVIETASWKDLADAIVVDWQPGQEGAAALVDILTGTVNPSGRLAMTFPIDYFDIPSSANFPYDSQGKGSMNTFRKVRDRGRRNVDFTEYAEGMDVGYRYFNRTGTPVSYPFGFGLSYTEFTRSEIQQAEESDGSVIVCVTVKNTGHAPGKEVVMVYGDGVLKGFAKTKRLEPGETETVRIRIAPYLRPRSFLMVS
ncbi:MAG: glycoside hydrolase family 3 C-terminal domain-containing protein [Bacteroidales bacterium]|nr:glycoside hydrolase family 3 C-terminal domain-containing protein [Bacteroidales bacterium]